MSLMRPKPPRRLSNTLEVFILVLATALVWQCQISLAATPSPLSVVASPSRLVTSSGANVSLVCSVTSATKPILCLWRTPYGHIYTLSEGVFAEAGRLRHTGGPQCGLEIVGVQQRDRGRWQCEVGAVIKEDFTTAAQNIVIEVKDPHSQRPSSSPPPQRSSPQAPSLPPPPPIPSPSPPPFGAVAVQEVGDDVLLNCSANREVHLCRWKTPYLNTYIVGEGIFVERGRIAWKGRNPQSDCTIKVSNLDLRDAGTWVCEIGSDDPVRGFQVQTKEFQIHIEKPLKLSTPTSLMQNANTDATLVCHANKPYDQCLWTTPYGRTYNFVPPKSVRSNRVQSHERGRIAFFAFADTDCGIVVRNVGPQDNGGWMCQLTSRTSDGKIFQNATDVVPLYTNAVQPPAAQPRAISDFNDYTTNNDAFGSRKVLEPTAEEAQRRPTNRQRTQPTPASFPTTATSSMFPSTASEMHPVPVIDLAKISAADSPDSLAKSNRQNAPVLSRDFSSTAGTTVAKPISIFRPTPAPKAEVNGVDPLELELLSRISGTRRDSRPFSIKLGTAQNVITSTSPTTTTASTTTITTTTTIPSSSGRTATSAPTIFRIVPLEQKTTKEPQTESPTKEEMRRLEIKRIRDQRRKKAQANSNSRKNRPEFDNQRKLQEERRRIERLREIARQKALEAKRLREEELKLRRELEEARQRKIAEEEQKRKELVEQREEELEKQKKRKEEEERQEREEERIRKEQEEKRRKEEEERKQQQELERKRQEEREKERKRKQEEELKRRRELEQKRRELEEQRRREEVERKRKEEEEKKRKEEEERKRKEEEERKRREEEERKKKEEEERRKAEIERLKRIQEQKEREEAERKRQEERRRKFLEEQRRKEEEKRIEEQRRKVEEERKKKEEQERARQLENHRRRLELERIRKEEAERKRKEEEEKQRKLEEEKRRQEEEEKQRKLEEEKRKKEEEERRREEDEEEEEKRLKELKEGEEDEQLQPEKQKFSIIAEHPNRNEQESSRSIGSTGPISLTNAIVFNTKDQADAKECMATSMPPHGNVTCNTSTPLFGESFYVPSGTECFLTCQNGYVSYDQRKATCNRGTWSNRLECVRPDALIIIGGKSDAHGVLNSVELVTGRGVCRGAVPPLPATRWRTITSTISEDMLMTCGGVNIFGDVERDCWTLTLDPPRWNKAPKLNEGRDAAAWAFEGDSLYVLGGSLGRTSGYTSSVEMYNVTTGEWSEGPEMTSSRYSHCAVALGNGSIIVTGGYGGLGVAERLDIDTGVWTPLPNLNPVRAQHGCALVNLNGEEGVVIVGGDSAGTRLKDVRFLSLSDPSDWRRMPDINTARWGRPAVGVVGGRITVAAGWDGSRDLDTVEYYDERLEKWRFTASRLQTERRWASATPISIRLFPTCVQKRE